MARRSIHHTIRGQERFGKRLEERLVKCSNGEAVVATAFFTHSAFREIAEALDIALTSGAKLVFLLGRFDYITEPRAVRALLRLSKKYPGQLQVLFDGYFGFHYKAAVFRWKSHVAVLLGSSNLTGKGMSGVGEINVEVIDQRRLHGDLLSDLNSRKSIAEFAENSLPAYERLYRRHKKWRDARARMERGGYAQWNAPVSRTRVAHSLDYQALVKLAHCNINSYVDDKTLEINATKARRQAARRGFSFPAAWAQVPAAFARLVADDDTILITDDIRHTVGLATAKSVSTVLDESDRRAWLIFYRYRRGHKLVLRDEARYNKVRAMMRIGSRDILKRRAIQRVAKILKAKSKRAQR